MLGRQMSEDIDCTRKLYDNDISKLRRYQH